MSAAAADLLAPGAAQTVLLLGARVGGLLLIAPVFSSRTLPVMLRTAVLVVLTWLLAPLAVAALAGAAPPLTPAAFISETLVGFGIGLGAAVFVGAAEAMGDLLAVHIGLSGASALDPLTNHSVPVIGQFANLFAVALLLSVDAHLLMIDALAHSARLLPIGAPVDVEAGLAAMVSLGSTLFALGLRFAAPVVAMVLLANVGLAILTRVAPQLNVLSVAFPIQIGLGLFALAASLPLIATFFTGFEGAYDALLAGLFAAFGAGG